MIGFTSNSQANQDRFVWEVTEGKRNGTFLDVGAWPFVGNSNSHALEQIGWRGLLVDTVKLGENLKRRRSPFLQADAVKVKWVDVLHRHKFPLAMDYLSLDVDDATADTLLAMPLDKLKFGVITIEHDSYRLGPGPRDVMRERLKSHGYDLICEDVMTEFPTPGNWVCFEDWWVSSNLSSAANRFRCVGKKSTEIFE